MELIEQGLAHVAGIHLAESRSDAGNPGALQELGLGHDMQLLAVAKWEEGVAHAEAVKLRSVTASGQPASSLGGSPGGSRRPPLPG